MAEDTTELTDEMDRGVEPEDEDSDELIASPFSPGSIRISTSVLSIGQLLGRIKAGEIDLAPDFQREFVWKDGVQSRLIESMLIRFPLPAFYMDATDDDKWLVIDGLQRLSTAKRFVLENNLRLRDLEYLGDELNGKTHKELPRSLQRRIDETQVTVYKIEKGTPSEVRYNLFKRINTGGLPLSPQEIRHALYPGQANRFLAELADSKEFKKATNYSIRDRRMADREMTLRFLAFSITPYTEYKTNLVIFLNEHMLKLNKMSSDELEQWKTRFLRAMTAAYDICDKWAFRKVFSKSGQFSRVSKPLFEAWSVNLEKLTDAQIGSLMKRRGQVQDEFIAIMRKRYFYNAISVGTGSPTRVKTR
ncbi:MAG: DUF262 domain-containing protein, partial [Deltaproteobacteria bacterium]